MEPRPAPFDGSAARAPARARGFVLLTMLVLLVALTVLVTTQVQRASVGQTLTANSSDYVLAETAAQSVLRYCEAAVMASAGQANSVRVTTPGTRGTDSAAWRTAAKWAASEVTFANGATAFPGVQAYSCLFEDATADLVPSMFANDINVESQPAVATCDVQPGMNPRLCKYRINARVVLDRGRVVNLQSEIRFAI
jgi:Tfp pilus assembly protein PilX